MIAAHSIAGVALSADLAWPAAGWLCVGAVLLGAALGAGLATCAWRREAAAWRALLARRDEQLAHTAHELRTPLASILMAIEMVRLGYATTPAETAEFLGEADLAARHLSFLVNDVLDEAALAAGQLRLELADHRVADLLGEALRVLGLQAERRQITIATERETEGLGVRADARRVLQVLFNLVGNAIKFSAPGQPVQVHVAAEPRFVRFRIVDEGPGVPAPLRPMLFQPFVTGQRGGSTGTGLGLHVTRRLVEQMGGKIGYAAREPRGSEFWFTLPCSGASAATVAATSSAAP